MTNKDDINIFSNVENLELYSDQYPFTLSLRIENFQTETEYRKFVKNCELLIRRCREYKHWRDYIIEVLQVNSCMITHEVIGEVTIDVHHHIPSLYTLVCSLVNKKIENNDKFCTFDIAAEAIELHFKNKLGYVTLIKSMHEKFHNGHLDIPIDVVKGDYKYFISTYSKYMDEQELDKINSRLAINKSNCSWGKDDYPIAAEG
jgi:hypothetical protein